MRKNNYLVFGEVYVDFFLDRFDGAQLRLGGVFHAIRAFDALGLNCCLAYFAPTYLEEDIDMISRELGVASKIYMGVIDKCPNINLINDSKEAKPISYEMILRDQKQIKNYLPTDQFEEFIIDNDISDVIIYPGSYDLQLYIPVLVRHHINLHIDFHYEGESLLDMIKEPISTAILSTSSSLFLEKCNGRKQDMISIFNESICRMVILKENRGGASLYNTSEKSWEFAPAYVSNTEHSIGVGDCYNIIFIVESYNNIRNAMRIAAYCTSLYAKTLDHEDFKELCMNVIKNKDSYCDLLGKRLSWEDRENIHLYIAAPDFVDVDTTLLNELEKSLRYHNFVPHRPIKENGLITTETTDAEKCNIYYKDIELINRCTGAIAVLLNNDPGTLVEVGMFIEKQKFVILYDPYKLANNNFLLASVTVICYSIDDLIDELFKIVGSNA